MNNKPTSLVTPTYNHLSKQAVGLVAWYPMALFGGNTLFDLSKNDLHAKTVSGTLGWSAGVNGELAALINPTNGANPNVAYDRRLNVTHITLSAWIMPVGYPGGTDFITIFSRELFSNNVYYYMDVYGNGGNPILRCGTYQEPTSRQVTWAFGSELVGGRPYLVTGTYDGAAWKLYVNGVLKAFTAETNGMFVANTSLGIGYTPGLGRIFNGSLWDARIYNRALSEGEVYSLYSPETRYELYQDPMMFAQRSFAANGNKSDFFSMLAF